jgi:hypothetical protein
MKSNVVALFKKIASIGVWGNGRFPLLSSRSALAAANARVSIFYFLIGIYRLILMLSWCLTTAIIKETEALK